MRYVLRFAICFYVCIALTGYAGSLQARGKPDKGGLPDSTVAAIHKPDKPGKPVKPAQVHPADETVLASYDELIGDVFANDELNRGHRKSLSKKLKNSRKKYVQGKSCVAANKLNAFLNHTSALRKKKYPEAGNELHYRGQLLRMDLLSSLPEGKFCGALQRVGMEPVVSIEQSDNTAFAANVGFGKPLQVAVKAGGESFSQFMFPGLEGDSTLGNGVSPGHPGIPMYYRLMAIPVGSTPVLKSAVMSSHVLKGINVYPMQETPVDAVASGDEPDDSMPPSETFADKPFVKDEAAYMVDALYPPDPVSVKVIGQVRDVNIVQVSIAAMQYNPVQKTVVVNDQVEFDVSFKGGTGAFISEQALNPFESHNNRSLVESSLLNGSVVYEHPIVFPGILTLLGEELVIVTHPDFIDEANTLADWKREKGITTRVVKTGTEEDGGIGSTRDEIKAWLQNRYDSAIIRFSYVLLLGDAEFIPPWYRNSSGSANTGTDLDYSLLAGNDLLADVGLARIPVDTAAQAEDVIDKIVNYEKFPPAFAPDFYNTASIPAYFQCCRAAPSAVGTTSRGYIETMEVIRDEMVDEGYDVERLYFSDTNYHGGYTDDETPRRYRDGTALPADLAPASGFDWDASEQDVIDVINEGRFLVIHRDHGGQNGWVFPPLASGSVNSLDNGNLLPVLFSVDCATGFFDNETANGDYGTTVNGSYLLERMLREDDGGVVGALGDTRDSPTWANNALTRGFADAIFPGVMDGYGGDNSIRRLADILNYGKVYMFTQVGVAQTAGSINQGHADSNNVMWHAFGDPTQEIWTSAPFRLPFEFTLERFPELLLVNYATEGAVITATQAGNAIGRAEVVGGIASLPVLHPPEPGFPIELSVSKAGAVSQLLTPPVSTDGPDLVVELSGPQFAAQGENIGSLLGVEVSNLGDTDVTGSVDDKGQVTGEGYAIDIVLSSDEQMPEGFAGVAADFFVEDGLLLGGRVSRTPAIAAGAVVTLSSEPPVNSDIGGTLPAELDPGDYFLCARIDPGDGVAESDETNNVHCVPITIRDLSTSITL